MSRHSVNVYMGDAKELLLCAMFAKVKAGVFGICSEGVRETSKSAKLSVGVWEDGEEFWAGGRAMEQRSSKAARSLSVTIETGSELWFLIRIAFSSTCGLGRFMRVLVLT